MAVLLGAEFIVYTSKQPDLGVLQADLCAPDWQRELGPIQSPLPGLEWQVGALGISVKNGDVLVVCGAPRSLSTLGLILKAKLKGAHTIWWGHYWSSTSRAWRASIRFMLMRLADAVVFYTDSELAEYRAARRGCSARPAYALNNGIETAEIQKLRLRYIAAQRTQDLLFIGRVTPKAELELLLEALARPECAGIRLDVVGDGPGITGLQEGAVKLGIADRISWHGGMVDETQIARIANKCKAFIYPGSVGLSLIHGLAYGLPAIVHDDRWAHMPEIAAHQAGRNGVTFRKGDVASLSGAIAALFANQTALERMSAAAISTISRSFNVQDMADRFVRAISDVSGHSTPA